MSRPKTFHRPSTMTTRTLIDAHRILSDLLPDDHQLENAKLIKLHRLGFEGDTNALLSAARQRRCRLQTEIVERMRNGDRVAERYCIDQELETVAEAA